MTELSELAEEATAAVPPRVAKILDLAAEQGWAENPVVSLCIRLTRPGDKPLRPAERPALPFYATWLLNTDKTSGRRSWRFDGARAANGQPLAYGDIAVYLRDPEVIYPDPPEGEGTNDQHEQDGGDRNGHRPDLPAAPGPRGFGGVRAAQRVAPEHSGAPG